MVAAEFRLVAQQGGLQQDREDPPWPSAGLREGRSAGSRLHQASRRVGPGVQWPGFALSLDLEQVSVLKSTGWC